MPAYLPLTLPDIVENALGVEFEAKALEKHTPKASDLQNLAVSLQGFYKSFPDFSKRPDELRPYIGPRFRAGDKFGANYVSGTGRTFEYEFDNRMKGVLVEEVKRYLLYCHGLAFHDRLPYLLDYFELDPHGVYAVKRLPAVKALLIEYASLSDLLRRGVLVPISDEVFGRVFDNELAPFATRELKERLPGIDELKLGVLEQVITKNQIEIERSNYIIDHFFPTKEYVDVMRELLNIVSAKFTSAQIADPFRVGMLAAVPGLDFEKLSANDIIQIRSNEEIFEKWRSIVRRILERMHSGQGTYSDTQGEFAAIAKEEIREWKLDLDGQKAKSSTLGLIKNAAQTAIIGGVSGAILDPHPSTAVGIAALSGLLQLGSDLLATRKERAINASVRQHFLVLEQSGL